MKKLMICVLSIFLFTSADNGNAETADVEKLKCPFTGKINATALFIRSKPDKKSKIVGRVLDGQRIEVLERTSVKETIAGKTASWYKISQGKKIRGYSFGGFIEKPEVFDNIPYKKSDIKIPDSIKGYYERMIYVEKKRIIQYKANVKRVGKKLILYCGKKKVVFTDSGMGDKDVQVYSFTGYYKDAKLFLVSAGFYEGHALYIINEKTGEKTTVWGVPVFSPDLKKFVCVSMDMEAGYSPNGIQIWEKRGNSFVKKYEKSLEWGPADPEWKNNKNIKLIKYERTKNCSYMKFNAYISGNGKSWVLR